MFCVSGLSEELDGYGFDRRNDVGGFDGRENTNSPFASPFHQVLTCFTFETSLLTLTIWFWTYKSAARSRSADIRRGGSSLGGGNGVFDYLPKEIQTSLLIGKSDKYATKEKIGGGIR